MQIVLADLQKRSLITINNNNISLHLSAQEMFRTSGDNPPTITTVESFPARVWFELISQSMIDSKGRHDVKHLINLKPIPTRMDIEEGFAREAFNLNFQQFLRQIRKIKNPDKWSLYSIVDVQPSRFSFAQIGGKQELFLTDSQPRLETTLLPMESDRPHQLRLLTDAMSSAIDSLDDPEPTISAISDWSRLANSESIKLSTNKDGFVDIREWLRIIKNNSSQQCAYIGHPYLEKNRQMLSTLIAELDMKPRQVLDDVYRLYWFRPGGSSWGLSEDTNVFLSEVRSSVRRQSSKGLSTTLIAPASVNLKKFRNFQRIFDNGLQAKSGRMSQSLEVLLIPNVCAAISVYVPLSSTVNVPIGIMNTDLNDIQKLVERLKPDEPELNKIWSKKSLKTKLEFTKIHPE